MKAAQLGLIGPAKSGALALEALFPGIEFTSGRRGVEDQARAMAQNLVLNRKWIAETYRSTAESRALQAAVDKAAGIRTAAQLQALLVSTMKGWNDLQRSRLSKHFSGEAFDVRPESGARGEAIQAAIERLPGLTKFLTREGGLVRWHAQFA